MQISSPNSRPIEFAFLGLLALFWGSSYFFIKIAVAEIPPVTLIAARVSIAAILLLCVVQCRHQTFPRDAKTWFQLLVQSFMNSFGAWVILAWGQQHIDSGLASVLNSTSPLFVFLITLVFMRRETVGALKIFGVGLGLLGVVMIVGIDVLDGFDLGVAGQLAALGGAVLYAIAAIYGRRFSGLPATVTAASAMIWATVILVPASLILDKPWTLSPSINALLATMALGIFCTGFALLIYFRLIHTLGSLGVSSQAYLRAGVGVMLGVLFLGETLTLHVGLGVLAAILGVAAINAPSRKT